VCETRFIWFSTLHNDPAMLGGLLAFFPRVSGRVFKVRPLQLADGSRQTNHFRVAGDSGLAFQAPNGSQCVTSGSTAERVVIVQGARRAGTECWCFLKVSDPERGVAHTQGM